ncbi:MAG TPA: hypothetical protein VI457_04580 [Methylococcaceae bacterium]|nr:hypothetical protein [Methylococcaceae bacterium]
MPYVLRDSSGRIMAVFAEAVAPGCSEMDEDAAELREFLAHRGGDPLRSVRDALDSSDEELIRVIEDIVEVLIEKNLIMFTDLPEAAQLKLNSRARIRHEFRHLHSLENLMLGESDIL